MLAFGFFVAACGDSAEAPQVTSLDPGDRIDEVAPARVTDLSARPLNHRAVELSWTEVDDGTGAPAQYQVRMVTGGDWNGGTVVREGACGYPVEGANVGSNVRCVVTGLEARSFYSFMVGSERAEISGTVPGDPSSVAPATTTDEPFFKDPASVEVLSGSNVEGTVGQAVQSEIRVLLRDSAGQPLPDSYIVWESDDGAGTTTSPVSISDDYGIARTVWTLGPAAGTQTLRAQAVGQPVLSVTADAAPGPVERLEFLADTLELAIGDEEHLDVRGWDAFGNPVEEIPLEWETSNRRVAEVGADGVGYVVGAGWARVRGSVKDKWRKRKTRDSVTVIVKGPPQPVDDLALDAVGEEWMTIRFTEVDDGGGEAASYETRLGSGGGSWDSAAEITEGGCASPLTGTAIGAPRSCTVPGLQAGTAYTVMVRPFRGGKGKGKRLYAESIASVAGTTSEAIQSPSGLTTESGAHQNGIVGDPLPAPIVVQVHDAQGAPVAGVDVVFTPSDGGSVSATSVTTGDDGRARVAWTLGGRAGTQTLQSAIGGAAGTSGLSNASLPPTVVPATAVAGSPVSLTVQPAALSLDAGGTGTVSARSLDEFGNVTSLAGLSWSSDDPGVASIDGAGRITGVGGGSTLIRATLGEVTGTAAITVAAPEEPSLPDPARIDDLRVSGVTERSVELRFTEVDDGSGAPAWTEIRYALSPMGSGWATATVLSSGTCASPVAGIAVGNTVRCVVDGLSEATAYDFQMVAWRQEEGNTVYSELSNVVTATTDAGSAPSLPAVSSVVVSPSQLSFDQVGQTHQLTAIAYDASNEEVSTPIEWTTSDSGVATVSSSGLVTARGAGTVLITATALCCGEAATSDVSVNIVQQPPPPPPPPPTAGVWVEQTWNFPDRAAMLADPSLSAGGNGTGLGDSRPIALSQPGPWGGSRVLENYYGVIPATSQPQVGTHWYLPDGAREIWIETWIRFGDDWQIGPDNPNYPNNVDHKTIFIWEGDGSGPWAQRWEVKFGPNWKSCVASAASHDVAYHHFFDPPLVVQTWDTRHQRRQQDPSSECDARRDVWDGQWHNFRLHLKMGTGDGQMEVWWDGVKMIDMGGNLNTRSGSRWFDAITFGGNRNQGTNQPMSFFYGPARVYNTNPGW